LFAGEPFVSDDAVRIHQPDAAISEEALARAEEMIEALLELGGVEPTARAALLESRGDGAAEGYASATPQSWSTDVPVPGRRRVWLPVALVLAVLLLACAGARERLAIAPPAAEREAYAAAVAPLPRDPASAERRNCW